MMSLRIVFLCLVATCGLAACSHSTGVTPSSTSSTTTTTTTTYGLTGQVVQAGTTNGIGSAAVTLVDSTGNVLNTTTDATGAFAFGATLASGTYYLQAAAPGYIATTSAIAIPATTFTVQLPLVGTSSVTTASVAITGPATLTVGRTGQLTASVVYTDGTQKDVTNVAKWVSTAPSVATVSVGGVLTAYTAGTTTITATFQDVSGSFVTTISP
jgi:trimeric autotransporter adhesin